MKMAVRPGDPGRWMAGAIRCLLVRVERLERRRRLRLLWDGSPGVR